MASDAPEVSPALNERTVNDLAEMVDLLASARDAMSDDMIVRLAKTASESVMLLDRLVRNEGVMQLLQVLERSETQYLLISLADALGRMSRELATAPPATGGFAGLIKLARAPGTQEGLRAVSLLGQYWNDSLRELHHRGG